MTSNRTSSQSSVSPRNPLGFPVLALIGLAALGLPRVVLHDLHLIEGASPLNWLLAIGPVAIWIAIAVIKKVPNPFLSLLVVGAIFGVMLVITHQILWDFAFQGAPPTIGNSAAAALIPRIAAIPSGIFTGTMIGAISGLIAWGIQAVGRRAAA